uniref:Uncharacterized protein n=1 Tax=Photinus pyralis TaxID=7054 RepID=A0A1Y1MZR6_PHOPY
MHISTVLILACAAAVHCQGFGYDFVFPNGPDQQNQGFQAQYVVGTRQFSNGPVVEGFGGYQGGYNPGYSGAGFYPPNGLNGDVGTYFRAGPPQGVQAAEQGATKGQGGGDFLHKLFKLPLGIMQEVING